MDSDSEDIPAKILLETSWFKFSHKSDDSNNMDAYINEENYNLRAKTIIDSAIQSEILTNKEILKNILILMGMIPPDIYTDYLLIISTKYPDGFTQCMNEMKEGDDVEYHSYSNLIESLARIMRGGMIVDVMDSDSVDFVSGLIKKAERSVG